MKIKYSQYVVYLTMYCGDVDLPKWYIGSSYEQKVLRGYNGSVKSKRYQTLCNSEQKTNKTVFRTRILSKHETRKEALTEELRLQRKHSVVKSEKYVNMTLATRNGFFGSDVSGKLNPNYGNKWSSEQRDKMSKQRSGKTIYKDLDGVFKLFDTTDPIIKEHNLKHLNFGRIHSDEVNYKKGTHLRGTKRPEHAVKLSGMNCHTAKRRGIYNSQNELMFDVSGCLTKTIKLHSLSYKLHRSTEDNPVDYTKTSRSYKRALKNGMIKFNGWYVTELK